MDLLTFFMVSLRYPFRYLVRSNHLNLDVELAIVCILIASLFSDSLYLPDFILLNYNVKGRVKVISLTYE